MRLSGLLHAFWLGKGNAIFLTLIRKSDRRLPHAARLWQARRAAGKPICGEQSRLEPAKIRPAWPGQTKGPIEAGLAKVQQNRQTRPASPKAWFLAGLASPEAWLTNGWAKPCRQPGRCGGIGKDGGGDRPVARRYGLP